VSEKKKQHFVPQFYLRNFAVKDTDRKMVSLYHLPSGKHIEKAPLKTQAYEDYFYKEAKIEDALGKIEGVVSPTITQAIQHDVLPARLSEAHHTLLLFVLFQAVRTPAASDELTGAMTAVWRKMAAEVPELAEHAGELQVKFHNAAAFMLAVASRSYPMTLDLRWKLLANRTGHPFITSDHPAVMYNQFLEHRSRDTGNTGVASKGLQIFLPLGPTHQLVLFDSAVYKVGGRKLTSTTVDVTHEKDVKALNLLQAVNADDTLYFADTTNVRDVQDLVSKAARFRNVGKSEVKDQRVLDHSDGRVKDVIQLSRTGVRTHLDLRCISVIPHVAVKPLDGRMAQIRDPQLFKLYSEFDEQVDAGKYKPSEFGKWLRDRHGTADAGLS
jgi:hypothetical protein